MSLLQMIYCHRVSSLSPPAQELGTDLSCYPHSCCPPGLALQKGLTQELVLRKCTKVGLRDITLPVLALQQGLMHEGISRVDPVGDVPAHVAQVVAPVDAPGAGDPA
jgi:hypothetical protein